MMFNEEVDRTSARTSCAKVWSLNRMAFTMDLARKEQAVCFLRAFGI